MINHFRTLLLNVAAEPGGVVAAPGEEYVPPSFAPLPLSGMLASTRRVLFGADPDRVFLNYRAKQLLGVVHATELDQYARAFDPRITYPLDADDDSFSSLFRVQASLIAPGAPPPGDPPRIVFAGELQADGERGRSYFDWRVRLINDEQISVERRTRPLDQKTFAYAIEAGLSNSIPLLGSDLQLRASEAPGAIWRVEGWARPRGSLFEIEAALRDLGDPFAARLFREPLVEPFRTFRNCWRDHPHQAYRVGGALLAYVHQLEALRVNP